MGHESGSGGSSLIGRISGRIIMGSIDGDFDGDGPSAKFFPLESCNSLLLFFFTANVDKTVTLAPSGLSPTPANNPSRVHSDSGVGEKSGKAGIVNVETEVGDKKHGLGGLPDRVFTGRAWNTGSPRLADASSLLRGGLDEGRVGCV